MRKVQVRPFAAATSVLIGVLAASAAASAEFVTIVPADLLPIESRMKYSADALQLEPIVSGSQQFCYMAGMHLPQGAKLGKALTAYKSGMTSNPHILVFRGELLSEDAEIILDATAKDNSGEHKSILKAFPIGSKSVIDNKTFLYTYQICLGSQDHFLGARISYN